MKNRYIVFIQDMWNNLHWVGEFNNLGDAIPDLKTFTEGYENVNLDGLCVRAGTFGPVFDTEIWNDEDSGDYLMVRGFILEGDK